MYMRCFIIQKLKLQERGGGYQKDQELLTELHLNGIHNYNTFLNEIILREISLYPLVLRQLSKFKELLLKLGL